VQGRFGRTQLDFKSHFPDRQRNVGLQVGVDTLDAHSDFYRRVGLPAEKVFEGQETVLQLKAYYGMKFRALWTDIVHIPTREVGVDFGDNFKPPFGNSSSGYRLVIPAKLTGTDLNLGAVRGKAETALFFSGKGSINLNHAPLLQGLTLRDSQLTFNNQQPQIVSYPLPALPANVAGVQELKYGFRLTKPTYTVDLTVTPQVLVAITAGYKSISRRFSTGWIPLNALRINLANIRLNAHEGTRSFYEYSGGRKTFEQISFAEGVVPGAAGDSQLSIVSTGPKDRPVSLNTIGTGAREQRPPSTMNTLYFRSAQNGKWIQAGLGRESLLGAVSKIKDGWASFEIIRLGGNRIALRSLQNNKLIRTGVPRDSHLAAVSDQIGAGETFEWLDLGGSKFALRSVQNGKYVRAGVGSESNLAAVSDRIAAWETFLKE